MRPMVVIVAAIVAVALVLAATLLPYLAAIFQGLQLAQAVLP